MIDAAREWMVRQEPLIGTYSIAIARTGQLEILVSGILERMGAVAIPGAAGSVRSRMHVVPITSGRRWCQTQRGRT